MTTKTLQSDVDHVRALAKEQAQNGAAGYYAVLTLAGDLVKERGFSNEFPVGQMLIGALLQEAAYEAMSIDMTSGSTYDLLSNAAKRLTSGG